MRKRSERIRNLLLLAVVYTAAPAAAITLSAGTGSSGTGLSGSDDHSLRYVLPVATNTTSNAERYHAPTPAQTPTPTPGDISTLLAVTGITAQLPDIHDMLLQARDSHSDRCQVAADLIGDGDRFHPRHLQNRLVQVLRTQLSEPALTDVLRWYESDLGLRIRNSEKKLRDDASYIPYLNKAAQSPDWRNREASLIKVEKHTLANRLGVMTGVEIEYGGLVLSGCIESYANKNRQAKSDHSIDAAEARNPERQRAKITRADQPFFERLFYQDTLDSMAFSLQDVSDRDLADYAEFVSGTNARQVFGSLVEAVTLVLRSASATTTTDAHKPGHKSTTEYQNSTNTTNNTTNNTTTDKSETDQVTTQLDH